MANLSRQTLDVIELLLLEDRAMHVAQIQGRLRDWEGVNVEKDGMLLVELGWAKDSWAVGGSRHYFELTYLGRAEGPRVLVEDGRDPIGSTLWLLLYRCSSVGDAIVEVPETLDRQAVHDAFIDVACLFRSAGLKLDGVDDEVSLRLMGLATLSDDEAKIWVKSRDPREEDRIHSWLLLRRLVIVLRALRRRTEGQPVP